MTGCFSASAQLGFCTGSKGDPIFIEDFGAGTNFGPALPSSVTSYTFINGIPNDGQYTIHYQNTFNNTWHNSSDHTPDNTTNGANGKALIVNASFTSGEFYKRAVTGLCVNTTFEFSAWVMNIYKTTSNVCPGSGIPIDVTFEIWDATETTLLQSGSTGSIAGTPQPVWTQYGLTFTTLPSQTDVILKIKNNGAGGCGNDLAIDDILFRSCGDSATITTPTVTGNRFDVCSSQLPVNLPLQINISNLTPHFFQWQQSSDNLNWINIPAANGTSYTPTGITQTQYYRVVIAQDAANLSNAFCRTISETFSVIVTAHPSNPVSNGDIVVCGNQNIPVLSVTVSPGASVNWYDAPTAGTLLLPNNPNFPVIVAGTYYAEAFVPNIDCKSNARTAVTLTLYPSPEVDDENYYLCPGDTKILDAGLPGLQYSWSTGETTQSIVINAAGTYSVTLTNADGCFDTKVITVDQDLTPISISIIVADDDILINASPAPLEFALDGSAFQITPLFENASAGSHQLTVRKTNGCAEEQVTLNVFVLLIPKFFTPNGDGYKDVWQITEFEKLPEARLQVFDRFGKLLFEINQKNPFWDGVFNGKPLPADDYWYHFYDGTNSQSGHFSLKR